MTVASDFRSMPTYAQNMINKIKDLKRANEEKIY